MLLLQSELSACVVDLPLAELLVGGQQLPACTLGECLGAHRGEQVVRGAKLVARVNSPVLATKPFAAKQVGQGRARVTHLLDVLSALRTEIPSTLRVEHAASGWMTASLRAAGFRQVVDNCRLHLLLHCGVEWHTPDATPIRGRLQRFIT